MDIRSVIEYMNTNYSQAYLCKNHNHVNSTILIIFRSILSIMCISSLLPGSLSLKPLSFTTSPTPQRDTRSEQLAAATRLLKYIYKLHTHERTRGQKKEHKSHTQAGSDAETHSHKDGPPYTVGIHSIYVTYAYANNAACNMWSRFNLHIYVYIYTYIYLCSYLYYDYYYNYCNIRHIKTQTDS